MIYFDKHNDIDNYKSFINELSYKSFEYKNSKEFNNYFDSIREKVLNYFNITSQTHNCIFTSNKNECYKILSKNFIWHHYNSLIHSIDNNANIISMNEDPLNNNSSVNIFDITDNNQIYHINNITNKNNKNNISDINNFNNNIDINNIDINNIMNLCIIPFENELTGKLFDINIIDKIKKYYSQNTIFIFDCTKYIISNKLDLSNNIFDIAIINFNNKYNFPNEINCIIIKKNLYKYFNYFNSYILNKEFIIKHNPLYNVNNNLYYINYDYNSINYISLVFLEKILNDKQNENNFIKSLSFYFYNKINNIKYNNNNNLFYLYDINLKYNYDQFNNYHGSSIAFNILNKDKIIIDHNEVKNLLYNHNIYIDDNYLNLKGSYMKIINKVNNISYENISFNNLYNFRPHIIHFSKSNTFKQIDNLIKIICNHYL